MEENKYYTPEIEDIHIGFEYEYLNSKDIWIKCNDFSNAYDYEDSPLYGIQKDIENKKIRVKYLTKEDIEAEGFEVQPDDGQPTFYSDGKVEKRTLYKKDGLFLTKWDSSTAVVILLDNLDNEILFQGTIKNKSEFKKILKMIGI